MNPLTLSIPARDGYALAATLHEPAERPAAVALVAGATGVKQVYYQRFATVLAQEGVAALTFDYRGIGQSAPAALKGFAATLQQWGTHDLAGAIDWLAARYPETRLFVVGHSVGGQLVGLADNNHLLSGLVGVGAQSGDWRLWPVPRRWWLAFVWSALVPGLTRLCGYLPGRKLGLGADLPAGVALEWARWCRSRGYVGAHLGKSVPDHFDGFRGRVLAYSFSDDKLAPLAAVEALFRLYKRAEVVQRRHLDPHLLGLPPVGHFGFFRKECAGLWPRLAAWLLDGAWTPATSPVTIS
jgi:predicted alpha/beta hydrolase